MRKAIVETATGLVVNVIEIEYDDVGGFSHWQCPDGCEMLPDGLGAQPGAIWNGLEFVPPSPPSLATLRFSDLLNRVHSSERPLSPAETTELEALLTARLNDSSISFDEMKILLFFRGG